jgi:Cys-tRNA(Pro)/Cys-tRNA(Cys) deacylase
MSAAEQSAPPHLVAFLYRHAIEAEFLAPGVPMPTVAAAAAAIGVPEEQILKTLLFAGDGGQHIIVVANGTRRVSRSLLTGVTGISRPRAASPEIVHEITGYVAGGVAPLALPAELPVIVDVGVAALPVAFGGGGREDMLLRVKPADIIRLNQALVAPVLE